MMQSKNYLLLGKETLFVPVGKMKKVTPEVIDFSHTNPYDMLTNH